MYVGILLVCYSTGISETAHRFFATGSSNASTWKLGHHLPTLSLEHLNLILHSICRYIHTYLGMVLYLYVGTLNFSTMFFVVLQQPSKRQPCQGCSVQRGLGTSLHTYVHASIHRTESKNRTNFVCSC
jgi:hypothetical protein